MSGTQHASVLLDVLTLCCGIACAESKRTLMQHGQRWFHQMIAVIQPLRVKDCTNQSMKLLDVGLQVNSVCLYSPVFVSASKKKASCDLMNMSDVAFAMVTIVTEQLELS